MKPSRFILALALALSSRAFGAHLCLSVLLESSEKIEVLFSQTLPQPVSFNDVPITPQSLYAAHRAGYLPERGGVWEVPGARGVIKLQTRKIPNNYARQIRKLLEIAPDLRITFNAATDRVIAGCRDMERTTDPWISDEIAEGYGALAKLGLVYSIEVWDSQGALIAGNFGILSNGHAQCASKFRDLKHPLADEGIGNLATEAEYHYFKSRNVEVFDVEVATIKGGAPKRGVDRMETAAFLAEIAKQHASPVSLFENAEEGKPLPVVESHFLSTFIP